MLSTVSSAKARKMSCIFLKSILCPDYGKLIRNASNTTNGNKQGNTHQMDAFIQLEIRLAKKKLAKQMIENQQSNDNKANGNRFEIISKPQEPLPVECCGADCHNCVWIDYAEKMIRYQEYIDLQK